VKLHQWLAPPSFAIASFIGSTHGLALEHRREVGSVSGEVMWSFVSDATSIRPITGRHSLPPVSATHIAIVHLTVSSSDEERYGFTLFRWTDMTR
jgi:hypothetical protein